MTHWHSLFLWSEQQASIVEAIRQYLEAEDYTLYNPFGRFPGMAYPLTIKCFVASAENSCSRILFAGEESDDLAQYLSQCGDCLNISLESRMAILHFYRANTLIELKTGLLAHCKSSHRKELEIVLTAESYNLANLNQGELGDIPLNALPEDLQEMAKQLDIKQADKLFQKLKNQLVKSVAHYDAAVLLQSDSDWNSQGGQYIRAMMACLQVPEDWREPDFSTLRQAYALQKRREYDVNTTVFPGDEEALAAVPNALEYIPVYGGKRD